MFPRKFIRAAVGFTLLAGVTACGDLLVVTPTENVPPAVATETLVGVQALLIGVYNRIQASVQYGSELMLMPEVLADNARPSDDTQRWRGQYANESGSHFGGWSARYQTVNEVNFVIASVDELEGGDASLKNRIKGEALFLRALVYFDLARIFAYEPNHIVGGWDTGVVLRTEPTRTAEDADFVPRSTVLETYQLIEQDLLAAIGLLTSDGTTNVFFANQAAAEALLARVYLYWEKWDDAITYATRALNQTTARLADPGEYGSMFDQAPNPESVFELNFDVVESLWVNTCKACYTHPQGTWFDTWPSDDMLALFEAGDARLSVYPTLPSGIRYVNKWTESRSDNTDNTPIIRYSEVLLIRAEAYAESGQEALAQADLTRLRAARNVGPITASGAALIQAVMDERRRELGFEGHRWFDLKRKGWDIPKTGYSALPPLPYASFVVLAPLPTTEVENNPQLVQNPGY